MNLNTLIVENEHNAQVLITSLLNEYCSNINLLGVASSKTEAVEMINHQEPDLVFLDVELGDGTGFEVLDNITYKDSKLVFTTAYDHYAIKAFKYEALDYVLKPYSPKDIIGAVQRANKVKSGEQVFDKINDMLKESNSKTKKKISINTSDGVSIVDIDDIIRVEADNSYSHIHLTGKKRLIVSKSLKEVEKQLPIPQFFRVHMSHLVNIKQIKKYTRRDGGHAIGSDGSSIPISRRKRQEFLNAIQF